MANKHKTFKTRTQVYVKSGEFFIIDTLHWSALKLRNWYISGKVKGYGVRKFANRYVKTDWWNKDGTRGQTMAHRLIMGARKGEIIDHIDGNFKNNRRDNLRFVTNAQNSINRRSVTKLKVPGVTKSSHHSKIQFRVRLTINGKLRHLGWFDDQTEAENHAIKMSLKYHGEFSPYWKG